MRPAASNDNQINPWHRQHATEALAPAHCMLQNSWRQSANRADQGQTLCQQQDLLPHSPATIPIGSRASGFVQSGFNEVAHRGPHDDLSRATSQNPQDSQGAQCLVHGDPQLWRSPHGGLVSSRSCFSSSRSPPARQCGLSASGDHVSGALRDAGWRGGFR